MKAKKFTFRPATFLIWVGVCIFGGWGISHWSSLSFWVGFAIVAAALLINGWIAEIEDNAPGGFNNPLPPEQTKNDTNHIDDSR
jgi:hypothetical protein